MPEPLPADLAEKEARVRELVAELVRTVPGAANVHTRARYTDDENEWMELATVEREGERDREVNYTFVRFVDDLEDDYTAGSTEIRFRYEIDHARSVAERTDGTNSHDEFVQFLMRLRVAFRENRTFGYESHELYHNLLTTAEPAREEEFDGALVHRTVKSVEVEVRS